jgi:hypothetical protein
MNTSNIVCARHFLANACGPCPADAIKSDPYNTGDKSLHEQFIARGVGAQFHRVPFGYCALRREWGLAKKMTHTPPERLLLHVAYYSLSRLPTDFTLDLPH